MEGWPNRGGSDWVQTRKKISDIFHPGYGLDNSEPSRHKHLVEGWADEPSPDPIGDDPYEGLDPPIEDDPNGYWKPAPGESTNWRDYSDWVDRNYHLMPGGHVGADYHYDKNVDWAHEADLPEHHDPGFDHHDPDSHDPGHHDTNHPDPDAPVDPDQDHHIEEHNPDEHNLAVKFDKSALWNKRPLNR